MNVVISEGKSIGRRSLYLWEVVTGKGERLAFGCSTNRTRAAEDAADAERQLASGRRPRRV